MKEWLIVVVEYVIIVINAMALVTIVYGTIETFVVGLSAVTKHTATGVELRDVYLRYARWLITGLTFQLAADIIETSLTPSWNDIGRLAAIAVIRTFLSYFLERDMKEAVELPREQKEE